MSLKTDSKSGLARIADLSKIYNSLTAGVRQYYESKPVNFVPVQQIVGITGACENVDTLFKVGSRIHKPLFLAQTGQLVLEQALQVFPGVYTIIQSGRDEETVDERHLRLFHLIEEEFDSSYIGKTRKNYDEEEMYESMLSSIEKSIKSMAKRVYADHGKMLVSKYKQKPEKFSNLSKKKFLRILYQDAVELLKKHGFPSLTFGDDLKANHEQKVVELVNKKHGNIKRHLMLPVFIMRYPKEIKFFNMKVSQKDSRVVLSADLILPRSGEAVGSSVREHRGRELKDRLLTSNMFRLHQSQGGKYEDFTWYVEDIIGKEKTNPHAGYGIGAERVMQYILDEPDIRQCCPIHLMAQFSGDWQE